MVKIQEINVIGSAVRKDEIPTEYRSLPYLGRGATTIAFKKDDSTALVFTRDAMKKDWLVHGLHMVSHWNIINPIRVNHIRGMHDMPLYMIEMPLLYPLSRENRSKVLKELKVWYKAVRQVNFYAGNPKLKQDKLLSMLEQYEENHPDSIIIPFITWLLDYDSSQYSLDMGARQFKQTANGEIVLLDPVIDQELYDLIIKHRSSKYN